MRLLLLLLLLAPTLLARPAGAAPEQTPLTLLPILSGEGVGEAETEWLERELRAAVAGLRHFALTGPAELETLGAPCRADLGCVRASLPRARDQLLLDLRVERLGRVLAVDLRLVDPSGPIERWRATLVTRGSPSVLGEAVKVLLLPHAPDAILFRRAREAGDLRARNLLLRDYPDSSYAQALLRTPTRPPVPPANTSEPLLPRSTETLGAESPGTPGWIDDLDG